MDAATKGNCNHCLQELPESSRHAAAMKHLQNAKALENDFAKVTDVIDLAIFDTKVEEALIALNKKQNELNENELSKEFLRVCGCDSWAGFVFRICEPDS